MTPFTQLAVPMPTCTIIACARPLTMVWPCIIATPMFSCGTITGCGIFQPSDCPFAYASTIGAKSVPPLANRYSTPREASVPAKASAAVSGWKDNGRSAFMGEWYPSVKRTWPDLQPGGSGLSLHRHEILLRVHCISEMADVADPGQCFRPEDRAVDAVAACRLHQQAVCALPPQVAAEGLRIAIARALDEAWLLAFLASQVRKKGVAPHFEHPPLVRDAAVFAGEAIHHEAVPVIDRFVDRRLQVDRAVPHAEAQTVREAGLLAVEIGERKSDDRAVVEWTGDERRFARDAPGRFRGDRHRLVGRLAGKIVEQVLRDADRLDVADEVAVIVERVAQQVFVHART